MVCGDFNIDGTQNNPDYAGLAALQQLMTEHKLVNAWTASAQDPDVLRIQVVPVAISTRSAASSRRMTTGFARIRPVSAVIRPVSAVATDRLHPRGTDAASAFIMLDVTRVRGAV
jgi:hypothetical protein